jgi:hypothetical protein
MDRGLLFGLMDLITLDLSRTIQFLELGLLSGKSAYFIFRTHGRYKGEIENGFRHGKGVFNTDDFVYEGNWKNGTVDGYGTLFFDSGKSFYYKGEWKDGKKHGHGLMIYKSGSYYDGQWMNNIRNGKGRMVWKNRDEEYNGEWKVIF